MYVNDKKDFSGKLFTNRRSWRVFKLGGNVIPVEDIYGRSKSSYTASQNGNRIVIADTAFVGERKGSKPSNLSLSPMEGCQDL